MAGTTLEMWFDVCGNAALLGWLALAIAPLHQTIGRVAIVVARWVVPGLIGVLYAYLMAQFWGNAPSGAGYGSLAAVRSLMSLDELLLAGWIHYLAFDLLVGSWEVTDAREQGVPHWLVLPCLALTFLFGPAGWALYLTIRWSVMAARRSTAGPETM